MSGVTLTHSQAVARLKDIFDELERLQRKGEAGPLVPEDETTFAELTREFDEVDEHRKALERAAATERVRVTREGLRTAAQDALSRGQTDRGAGGLQTGGFDYDLDPILEPDSIEQKRFRNPWDLSEVRTFGKDKTDVTQELRSRALSAVERMGGASDRVRAAATDIIERYDDESGTISQLCLATSSPEYMRAWSKKMRSKPLTDADQQVLSRTMSLTDASGGVLVPFQLDPTVIITSAGSRNDIRMIARSVVATTNVWNGVSSGAASWSWDAEGVQVSDDTTTFGQPVVPNYKAAGFIPISIEALQDEANVTQEVARILAFGKDTLEAAAFATGSGVGQPTGIVTALVASSPSIIQTSTTTDTFAAADIYKVDGALPARYRRGASWLANRKTFNLVRQFDTSGGAQMWERIGADVPPQLVGRGAYESEDMDGTINAGAENYMAAYGDFSNYVIADRIGFSVEFIPHLFGANGRLTGSRGWYAYYRVGADSVNDSAFVLLNVT
jgi:HK97 family phage major capsid protein